MIEKYVSQDAVVAHAKSAELADLQARLAGKLNGDLDVQVLSPHPAGTQDKGTI
jgi:quinol monooxygenase YgiN